MMREFLGHFGKYSALCASYFACFLLVKEWGRFISIDQLFSDIWALVIILFLFAYAVLILGKRVFEHWVAVLIELYGRSRAIAVVFAPIVLTYFYFSWRSASNSSGLLHGVNLSILLGVYCLYVSTKKSGEKEVANHSAASLDSPILLPEEDRLARRHEAQRIARTIEKISGNENYRIGITGEWGSGKTSFMKLIEYYLPSQKFYVGWFNPWHFRTVQDASDGLIAAFESAIPQLKNKPITFRRTAARLFAGSARFLPATKLGEMLHDLFDTVHPPIFSTRQQEIISELAPYLCEERKVVLFVDDLDRANREVVLQLLMMIKEIVDFPKVIFILGISLESTVSILEKRYKNRKEAADFLNKIVNWKVSLPRLARETFESFVRDFAAEHARSIRIDELLKLSDHLPKNPRALKQLLKVIDAQHDLYEKYSCAEISLHTVYVAETLKFRFPELTNHLTTSRQLFRVYTEGETYITESQKNDATKARNDAETAWKTDHTETEVEEFVNLVSAFSEAIPVTGTADFYMLRIGDPNTVTTKEYECIKKSLSNECDVCQALERAIAQAKPDASSPSHELQRQFVKMLNEDLTTKNEEMVSLTAQAEKEEFVEASLVQLYNLYDSLVDCHTFWLGTKRIYDLETTWATIRALLRYSSFNDENFYQKAREREKQLLNKIKLSMLDQPEYYLPGLDPYDASRLEREPLFYGELRESLIEKYSEHIVSRLEEAGFISNYWRTEPNWAGLILFTNSTLYKDPRLKKLFMEKLASARTNRAIWKNALEMIRMGLYGALNHLNGGPSASQIVDLFTNHPDLLESLFRAATTHVLDRRIVGSFNREIEQLSQKSQILKEVFDKALPVWWQSVLLGQGASAVEGADEN